MSGSTADYLSWEMVRTRMALRAGMRFHGPRPRLAGRFPPSLTVLRLACGLRRTRREHGDSRDASQQTTMSVIMRSLRSDLSGSDRASIGFLSCRSHLTP